MIIKGKSRSGPVALAAHLGNAEKNERVRLVETRGAVASDLRGALIEMDAVAVGTRCVKPLYHAAISPAQPHRLTSEQRAEAVEALEEKLGLKGHARVVVLHEKLGREHIHVVWSRIDIREMRSVSDSHNYRKHEEVARDLERRFGHERVQGAHHERDGVARPDRTPSRAELRQEERTGVTGKRVKEEVSEAFRSSDGPEAFSAALQHRGYLLAAGDRREFVIVDKCGGVHSLARRIDSMKAADLRAYMEPLDRSRLPDIETAQAVMEKWREAQEYAALEKSYGRGGDYVTQSRAAQREHEQRQAKLDKIAEQDPLWDRIDQGEAERDERQRAKTKSEENELPESSVSPAPDLGGLEITEELQAKLDRLLGHGVSGAQRDGPDRQNGAPGGGRTRSR